MTYSVMRVMMQSIVFTKNWFGFAYVIWFLRWGHFIEARVNFGEFNAYICNFGLLQCRVWGKPPRTMLRLWPVSQKTHAKWIYATLCMCEPISRFADRREMLLLFGGGRENAFMCANIFTVLTRKYASCAFEAHSLYKSGIRANKSLKEIRPTFPLMLFFFFYQSSK